MGLMLPVLLYAASWWCQGKKSHGATAIYYSKSGSNSVVLLLLLLLSMLFGCLLACFFVCFCVHDAKDVGEARVNGKERELANPRLKKEETTLRVMYELS